MNLKFGVNRQHSMARSWLATLVYFLTLVACGGESRQEAAKSDRSAGHVPIRLVDILQEPIEFDGQSVFVIGYMHDELLILFFDKNRSDLVDLSMGFPISDRTVGDGFLEACGGRWVGIFGSISASGASSFPKFQKVDKVEDLNGLGLCFDRKSDEHAR